VIDIALENLSDLSFKELERSVMRDVVTFPKDVELSVKRIIDDVERCGDEALIRYTERFDGLRIGSEELQVDDREIIEAARGVDDDVVQALKKASERVMAFHEQARPRDWEFTDRFGNVLGQKYTPLERVGMYIPGGKASYPSSLIMTAVPAAAAGVRDLVVCSPPSSFETPSALCAALRVIGFEGKVFRVGGVQAVAALALGNTSIPRVDKIVGPGNLYVAMAKKALYGLVDIDMVAGPSEVLILVDGSVHPRLTAVDLLAQAEHDELARAMCLSASFEHAREIRKWVLELAEKSPRRDILSESLSRRGWIYAVRDLDTAVRLANSIAAEHLEIQTEDSRSLLPKIKNAGAVFLGPHSAESFGDYVAGPSHVLPTGGTARYFSPLNVLSFMKVSSIIEMSPEGVRMLGGAASILADSEGLRAHGDSVRYRMKDLTEDNYKKGADT
jgi:histidinol dehydrogenase